MKIKFVVDRDREQEERDAIEVRWDVWTYDRDLNLRINKSTSLYIKCDTGELIIRDARGLIKTGYFLNPETGCFSKQG